MRDKWYADNRDIVKWSVVITLAERYAAKHILQVLYYRPTDWALLNIDGEQVSIPDAVIQHFRNAASVSKIETSVPVEVFTNVFVNRNEYQRDVVSLIQSRPVKPGIVLLDPDTGLETRKPCLNHVLARELAELWAALKSGDVLIFYQHQTNRNGQEWITPKKAQFEQAIGLPVGGSKLAWSEPIARDVAFFYAQKASQ